MNVAFWAGLVRGLAEAVKAVFRWLSDKRLFDAGATRQRETDREVADDAKRRMDAASGPADRDDAIDRLRRGDG